MSAEAKTGLAGDPAGALLSARYRLKSKLGSGGMSTVYLARDQTLERWIAVKLLHREISDDPSQLERFRREARAVAQLSHPNVVAVIDAGEDSGRAYIIFEYIEGETLKQRIDRLGRLPLDEAAAYAIEIGRGLAAAHARKLVHRDVKPQNVLIDPEGRAKVTDFGIARSLESDGLTKTGRVLGTTDYVSPEQAMGHGVDARSDIYSLGVLLYEMLTGSVPFRAETLIGVAMKHVNAEFPDVQRSRAEVSSALAAVIERATLKDPKKRYPDMAAMLSELEEALEVEVARSGTTHGEATAVLKSMPDLRRKLLASRRASLAGVLLVVAAAAAAIGITVFTDGERRGGAANSGGEIKLASALDFDPPPGDGEHPDTVSYALDRNPDTVWTTETYNSSVISEAISGKEGVGLIIDAGKRVSGRSIEIISDASGWKATIYGAESGPPESIEGWGEPLSDSQEMDTKEEIQLKLLKPSRYYLIWITELSDTRSVQIGEVKLFS